MAIGLLICRFSQGMKKNTHASVDSMPKLGTISGSRLLIGPVSERPLGFVLRGQRDARERRLKGAEISIVNKPDDFDRFAPASARHFNGIPSVVHWPTGSDVDDGVRPR
ncbi:MULTISPECIES: hypothetical protein [unclassified Lysobacter]|uniref:hypothetical protein n=1 Tax=unclassified Lysobacter TaxID=2635362 RepID=UPI002034E0B2|nr:MULTISPECIES: hypothetical protein [unclassified Lysobacter]